MEYQNYFKIKKLSLRYNYYAIIDSAEHMADSLFARNEIRVCDGEEYVRSNSAYRFIIYRIRKKDNERFLDAMEKLKSKMLLCGNPDYPEFCANFQEGIQKRSEQNDVQDYFKQRE